MPETRPLSLRAGTARAEEVPRVTVTATGGTFTLTFNGQTTAAIAFDATADDVRLALVALSNIGPNDIGSSGGPLPASSVNVTFLGALQKQNFSQMTADSSGLTGGSATTSTITDGLSGNERGSAGHHRRDADGRDLHRALVTPDVELERGHGANRL